MQFLPNLDEFAAQEKVNELILVDDFSDASTKSKLTQWATKSRLIHAEKDIKGKKNAITTGVYAAKSNHLVFSDIDCKPASKTWAKIMSQNLDKTCEIVIGYGAHLKKAGFLNKFIRFETVMTAIQMMSYAKAGIPYMAVGRNLAYKKSLFLKHGGMEKHLHMASGDDDLFIRDAATKENSRICLDQKSFTYAEPAVSWKQFFDQKRRHITTASAYNRLPQVLLGIYAASHIGFFVLLLLSVLLGQAAYIIEATLMFYLISFPIFALISRKLDEKDLILWFPVLDFLFFVYYIGLIPFLFIRKQTW